MLSNIIEINVGTSTAVLEPNVPMDKLVQATLSCGMIPPVVMEFPGITSSSFKHGYFSQSVKSVEMVLGNGKAVTASKSLNSDLFYGAAGALGTFGIVTKLEISLVQARRFVKLVYQPYATTKETIAAVRKATESLENDYVDAILFSSDHGVVMTGTLTDDIPPSEQPQTFSRAWDPWFYHHVMKKPLEERSTDYVPLAEYLFRYDRGGFWVGALGFKYFFFVPFNRLTRWILDDLLHTRAMYRGLHGSSLSQAFIIQDLSLPYAHAENGSPQIMLNVGIWSAASQDLSTSTQQKLLYSNVYYTQEEFWQLYDTKWYEDLRRGYSATTLPSVYEKVRADVPRPLYTLQRLRTSWPFAGLVGLWHVIMGGDLRDHKQFDWMSLAKKE
ncbi:hypothetical protein BU23DRAFT_656051 [Bimuria novae-zelandiae CBS 107.79]|uniref:Delta(24)-sterol reductase n=1 Tax=Bimuria novae-zelandiae CBS 107.79 TaxID=1447943 RepID=A0A6A5UXE4_9PLEO|nr:hypothetical protein BU23DRAFT_656051 [Bimuria novae-zelandiae CBS 107.79]